MAKRPDQAARISRREPGAPAAPHYSAEDARGGEIVLGTRVERLIFTAGLAMSVILALFLFHAG